MKHVVAWLDGLSDVELVAQVRRRFPVIAKAIGDHEPTSRIARVLAIVLTERTASERATWPHERALVANGNRTRQSADGALVARRALSHPVSVPVTIDAGG